IVPETQKKQRLVLIDGHSLVYRAFFALPSLTDREGNIVNAAYGFTSMLLLALQEHQDYVLASFDLGGRTFRHEELAQYKATRRTTLSVPWRDRRVSKACTARSSPATWTPCSSSTTTLTF